MLAMVAAIHSTLTAAPSRHWLAGWSRFSGIAGGQGRFYQHYSPACFMGLFLPKQSLIP